MASVAARSTPVSRRLKALADPRRLRIIERLRNGERCICDLIDALGAGQSLLSFHLKVLREAGVVGMRRDGRWTYWSLRDQALRDLEAWLTAVRRDAARRRPRAPRCTP